MFVGGELGGAAVLSGLCVAGGREKSLLVLTGTDAVTSPGVAILLEGRRVYPFPTPLRVPGEILGSVWAAASSSSHSFLKVVLGARQSGGTGAWWNSPEGAAVADHLRFRRSSVVDIFSLSFILFSFWA